MCAPTFERHDGHGLFIRPAALTSALRSIQLNGGLALGEPILLWASSSPMTRTASSISRQHARMGRLRRAHCSDLVSVINAFVKGLQDD